MPTYKITDPTTGNTVRITGDTPPTESDLHDIFSKVHGAPPPSAPPRSDMSKFAEAIASPIRDAGSKIGGVVDNLRDKKINLADAALQMTGHEAGAVNELIGKGIGAAAGEVGRLIGKAPGAAAVGNFGKGALSILGRIPVVSRAVGEGTKAALGAGAEQLANLKQYEPNTFDNLAAVANITGLAGLGGVGGLAKKGAEVGAEKLAGSTAGDALRSLSKLRNLIPEKVSRLSEQQIAANMAAKRAGIPISIPQENATLGNIPTGVSGAADRFSSMLTGGRVAKEQHMNDVSKAVHAELEALQQSPLGTPATDPADALHRGISARVGEHDQKSGELFKALGKAGSEARVTNGAMIADDAVRRLDLENIRLFDEVPGPRGGSEWLPVPKGTPTGLNEASTSYIQNALQRVRNLDRVGKDNYPVFRRLKTEIGGKANEFYNNMDSAEAKAAEHALNVVYDAMGDAERAHIAKIAGPEGVALLDDLNSFYSQTIDAQKLASTLIGSGKDVGERGYKTAQEALDNMVKPQNIIIVEKLRPYLDKESMVALRAGLLTKIIEKGSDGETFTMAKMGRHLDQYLGDSQKKTALENILGTETVGRLSDVVAGAKRAGYTTAKMIDASNPSGSGAKMGEQAILATLVGGGTVAHGIPGGVGAVLGANYAANIAQRMLTRKGMHPAEKALLAAGAGAAVGSGVAGATGQDKTVGAIAGGALGLGGLAALARLKGVTPAAVRMAPRFGEDGIGGVPALPAPIRPLPGGGDMGPELLLPEHIDAAPEAGATIMPNSKDLAILDSHAEDYVASRAAESSALASEFGTGKKGTHDFLQGLRKDVFKALAPAEYRKLMAGDNASALSDATVEKLSAMTQQINDRLRADAGDMAEASGLPVEQYFGRGAEIHVDDLVQAVREAGLAKDKDLFGSAGGLPLSANMNLPTRGALGYLGGYTMTPGTDEERRQGGAMAAGAAISLPALAKLMGKRMSNGLPGAGMLEKVPKTRYQNLQKQFSEELQGKELSSEQQEIADVLTGKMSAASILKGSSSISKEADLRGMGLDMIRESLTIETGHKGFGGRHIMSIHYAGKRGPISAEEAIGMGDVVRNAQDISFSKGKLIYSWERPDGVKQTVVSSTSVPHEPVITTYTNKKGTP